MKFTESWYSEWDKRALQNAALDARRVTGHAVEVGSYEGRSALILAPILAPRRLVCIDLWKPTDQWPHAAKAYKAFKRNTSQLENIDAVKGDWKEWADRHHDDTFALVHLDDGHDYTTVLEQIEWFYPRMSTGGVLCGHDYQPGEWDGVVRAVTEALPDAEVQSCVWRVTC